jgi:hypothetical protein
MGGGGGHKGLLRGAPREVKDGMNSRESREKGAGWSTKPKKTGSLHLLSNNLTRIHSTRIVGKFHVMGAQPVDIMPVNHNVNWIDPAKLGFRKGLVGRRRKA